MYALQYLLIGLCHSNLILGKLRTEVQGWCYINIKLIDHQYYTHIYVVTFVKIIKLKYLVSLLYTLSEFRAIIT